MYRQVLSETLARDNRFGCFFDPTLALFPNIAEQNDLLQLLVTLWERKFQALSGRSKVHLNHVIFVHSNSTSAICRNIEKKVSRLSNHNMANA
jgi:hypothetical protein